MRQSTYRMMPNGNAVKPEKKTVVCHLCNYSPPFSGNFIASLIDLEKKLITKNIENKTIYIFSEEASSCMWIKEMQNEGKSIYFVQQQQLKCYWKLKKILKDNNVNILHLHFNFPVIVLTLLKLFCQNIHIIFHFHMYVSKINNTFTSKVKRLLKIFLFNNIPNFICAVSDAVYNDLIKLGVHKDKCCYIDNGIVFSRLETKCENGKDVYNMQNKKILMIYGTFFYIKGVDIAINAIKNIVDEHNIILMIVCQNKGYVLKQINKMLNHIPEWLFIVPSQENISFYYKMSDIYITPSREEAFSYNMLESIYCGTPVIRSDIPAMDRKLPYDIKFPVNDIFSLQQNIISVLNKNNSEIQIMLSEQKEYIVKKWNIDIWSDKVLNMYFSVISSSKQKITGKFCDT